MKNSNRLFDPDANRHSVSVRVRPPRIAILVCEEDPHWQHTALRIIEWSNQYWGGVGFIAIPTDGKEILIDFWLILESYDPDYIFKYHYTHRDTQKRDKVEFEKIVERSFKKFITDNEIPETNWQMTKEHCKEAVLDSITYAFTVSEGLQTELSARLNPFWHQRHPSSIIKGHVRPGGGGSYVLNKVDLMSFSEPKTKVHPIDFQGISILQQLRICTHLGNFDPEFSKRTQKIDEEPYSISEQIVWSDYGDTPNGQGIIKNRPWQLAQFGCAKYRRAGEEMILVIVGDSVHDYYLFKNLACIRNFVYWFPQKVSLENRLDSNNEFLWLSLFIRKQIANSGMKVKIFGQSQHDEVLQLFATELQEDGSVPEVEVVKDCEPLIENCSYFYEKESGIGSLNLQFSDRRSISQINTPKPQSFKTGSENLHYWISEITIDRYKLPPQLDFATTVFDALNYGTDLVRVAKGGLAYLCPFHTNLGIDFDHTVPKPSINLIDGYQIFDVLLSKQGYTISLSDKGSYQKYTTDLFGSFHDLYDFISIRSNQQLIELIRDKNSRSGDGKGIILGKRPPRLLDFQCFENLLGNPEDTVKFIDYCTDRDIFLRGLIFQCKICRNSDWYPIKDVTDTFTCHRCYSRQKYTSQHWKRPSEPKWYHKMNEVAFQAFDNDLIPVILTLGKLVREAKSSFIYSPEIDVYGNEKPYAELDICCVRDGQIIVGEASCSTMKEKTQLNKLSHLARVIKADEIILSTSAKEWKQMDLQGIFGDLASKVRKFSRIDLLPNEGP